jgi:hypothetical protein
LFLLKMNRQRNGRALLALFGHLHGPHLSVRTRGTPIPPAI